jgi:hypothetical protein
MLQRMSLGWSLGNYVSAGSGQVADSAIDNQNSGPHPYAVWQVNCILRQTAVVHQSEIKNL